MDAMRFSEAKRGDRVLSATMSKMTGQASGKTGPAGKSKGSLPVSRHPLFPAMVGIWFAALFGLGSLAIRPTLIESFVLAVQLDLVIPATAPPLGITARILLALSLFVLGGVLGFFLARRIVHQKAQSQSISRSFRVASVARPDEVEDEDFARLEAARVKNPAVANPIAGRRRALAMEENFALVVNDFMPVPGGAPQNLDPQILDLADLGMIGESPLDDQSEDVAASHISEPPEAEAGFDPWQRRRRETAALNAANAAQEAEYAVGDVAPPVSPIEAESEFAPARFAAPTSPMPMAEENGAPVLGELSQEEDAMASYRPSDFIAQPALSSFGPELAEMGSETPRFSAPASVEAVATPAATAIPNFGSSPHEGAEALLAAPLASLGVVQLAERLALAISRRRTGAEAAVYAPLEANRPEAEADAVNEPEERTSLISCEVVADPAPVVPEMAPTIITPPALPAAFRPFSFDDADDDEPLEPLLPPRRFTMAAPAVQAEKAESTFAVGGAETSLPAEAADEPQDDGFGSLLGMKPSTRPGFVRIDEPVDEDAPVEPVVIFPGQTQRIMPAANPAAGSVAPRPFDAPPSSSAPITLGAQHSPSAPIRIQSASAQQPADAQETERALKAALATLQRMSGAA